MTDNTTAPKRIWVEDERPIGGECYVHNEPTPGVLMYGVEYIRADLAYQQQSSLRDLVENYLTRSGIGESYFGAASCGNSNFVKRMRDGGRFFPETEAKVRAFIANNPAP